MVNERKPRNRPRAPWMIPALLTGWIVVVVVGGGREPDDDPLLGVEGVGMVLYGVLVVLALLGLILVIYLRPQKNDEWVPPGRQKQPLVLLIAAVVTIMLWRPNFFDALRSLEEATEADGEATEGPFELPGEEPAADSVAQATDVLLVLLVGALLAGLWFLVRRRAHPPEPIGVSEHDAEFVVELLEAIEDASIELEASNDPRTNVMRAYAGLEQVLASRDMQRRPSETSAEFVRRALANLRVDPQPLVRLGALYELARFSRDDISLLHQRQAREALEQSRAELAALT